MLKLSVITPTLNQGKFIERAIRSVLDQGYEDLEYFVVDGGSTDETVEIIKRYEDRIDWWVSEPDQGQTDAIAKGIERATGDVIAYVNSDDYFLPGAFAKAISALETSGASWMAGASINVDEHDRPGPGREDPVWVPLPPSSVERWPRGRQWWVSDPWLVPQPSSFWRRELFERYGGFRRDMHFGFDAEFMVRLALAGEMPVLIEDRLAARVFHAEAKSADLSRTDPELVQIVEIHRGDLTARERVLLRLEPVTNVLSRLGAVGRRAIGAVLRAGGNLLEHVPERVRPKIRTRDRRAP